MARCFMGFFVAVIWIMAIADEVVQVLQVRRFLRSLLHCIIDSHCPDIWFHLWTLRCYHWLDYIRCRQFSRGSGS